MYTKGVVNEEGCDSVKGLCWKKVSKIIDT